MKNGYIIDIYTEAMSLDPDGWLVRRNTSTSQNWYLDKGRKQKNSRYY